MTNPVASLEITDGIPPKIWNAIREIELWAELNGYRLWVIGGICSRDCVNHFIRESLVTCAEMVQKEHLDGYLDDPSLRVESDVSYDRAVSDCHDAVLRVLDERKSV